MDGGVVFVVWLSGCMSVCLYLGRVGRDVHEHEMKGNMASRLPIKVEVGFHLAQWTWGLFVCAWCLCTLAISGYIRGDILPDGEIPISLQARRGASALFPSIQCFDTAEPAHHPPWSRCPICEQ